MLGWAKSLLPEQEDPPFFRMVADPHSEVSRALDLANTNPKLIECLGNSRCKRFSAFIDNSEIKAVNVCYNDDDPGGDDCATPSFVDKMLEDIAAA